MAVQTGEGTIEIIYGSISIPAGAHTLSGYLARPDGEGEWPTVLLFGPEPQPTSSVKNICRILARHGIAALAPDMTQSHEANLQIALRTSAFISDRTGDWSNAQFGYGALSFGPGIYDASGLAVRDGRVIAVASVAATFDERVVQDMSEANVPTLWIGSRSDESTDIDASIAAQSSLPLTTFVVHPEGDSGFWDDNAEGFDESVATDTVDRIVAFFGDELPPRV